VRSLYKTATDTQRRKHICTTMVKTVQYLLSSITFEDLFKERFHGPLSWNKLENYMWLFNKRVGHATNSSSMPHNKSSHHPH